MVYCPIQRRTELRRKWRIYDKLFRNNKRSSPRLSTQPLLIYSCGRVVSPKIRQNKNCEGIYLPNNQAVRISQLADDTTIITYNTDSLKSHLQTIEWFGTVSGLELNKKKTKAMWLGTMKHSNSNILECKSTKNPIKWLSP